MQSADVVTTIQPSDERIAGELIYQRGFEAALRPETFEKPYEAVTPFLQEYYPDIYMLERFRRGYTLAQDYVETLQAR